ncbi:hypothetical protein Lal_00043732 [Lupinus albus]|nr:hypothetical protein Lal_00043732 [Lupinus albus]
MEELLSHNGMRHRSDSSNHESEQSRRHGEKRHRNKHNDYSSAHDGERRRRPRGERYGEENLGDRNDGVKEGASSTMEVVGSSKNHGKQLMEMEKKSRNVKCFKCLGATLDSRGSQDQEGPMAQTRAKSGLNKLTKDSIDPGIRGLKGHLCP